MPEKCGNCHGLGFVLAEYNMWRCSECERYTIAEARDHVRLCCEAHEPMLAALKEIAESPHRYFEDKHGTYVLGVADGHRFCANVAKAAIAAVEGASDGD